MDDHNVLTVALRKPCPNVQTKAVDSVLIGEFNIYDGDWSFLLFNNQKINDPNRKMQKGRASFLFKCLMYTLYFIWLIQLNSLLSIPWIFALTKTDPRYNRSFFFFSLFLSSLSKSRAYQPCCRFSCGLSCQDWFITLGLLLVLYAIVTGIFTGMMLWLQNTQKTILNGDYALWICFSFGMMYWIIVTIMVATGERVQFDSAIAEEDLEETKSA